MLPKIRNIIIFVIIATIFILIYIFFVKASPDQGSLVSSSNVSSPEDVSSPQINPNILSNTSVIAQDFLVLLLNVKNIKLNDAIFSDPSFNSLHDSSIVLIPDGNEGRPNPFAQFGAELPAAGVAAPIASPSGSTPSATSGTGTVKP